MCGRTLLRGEQPDVYLAGGQRRIVGDLCGARAAQEGWLRESDGPALTVRPPRRRRGRGLMGRLRDLREPRREASEPLDGDALEDPNAPAVDPFAAADWQLEEQIGGPAPHAASVSPPAPVPAPAHVEPRRSPRHVRGIPANGELRAARALEVFNLGEGPRRVAGVARSLGAPYVAVRPLAGGGVVSITVAWELCWYRYEVDLADADADAEIVAQGSELDELAPEDRAANAQADERGELQMLGAQPAPEQ